MSVLVPKPSLLPVGVLHPLAWASAVLCAYTSLAQAQDMPVQRQDTVQQAQAVSRDRAPIPVLKDVVVSATRQEQDADALPMSIDVIDARAMEAGQVSDIRELAQQLPNVEVPRSPARFTAASSPTGRDQNSGFNIRGLDGNRVLMLVDGVRLPRSYAFSANAFGRDYLDLGLVQRVEVLRGSTPALYGSDGMGGLVNFVTLRPQDLIAPGQTLGGRVAASYDGSDNGRKLGLTLAGQASPEWSWLLSAGLGRAHALDNMGRNDAANASRTRPNPQNDRSQSLLGKLIWKPSGVQQQTLSLEQVNKRSDYALLTARSAAVSRSDARTDMDRWRASWQGQWQLDSVLADDIKTMASYQKSNAREWVNEHRTAAPYRERDVTYDESALQLNLQASKLLRWGAHSSAKFTYGLDYNRNKVVNSQNGVTPPAGETYPLKRFPDTTETSTALFAQGELIQGAWSITPGVRVDSYRISPKQAGFASTAVRNSDSAVSPKLGVLFQASDHWSVYGNYAAGFRAPNAGQINAFFENPGASYRTIPNPHLRPEKSQSVELGLRGRMDGLRLDAAAFTGHYKDFIQDQQLVSGQFGNPRDPAVFQSINVDKARISGLELKADYDWGHYAGGQWQTRMAWGYTRGKQTQTHKPLDTVSPQQLVFGVRYDASVLAVQLSASHWAGKKAKDAAAGDAAWLNPSATVLDLSAQWRIRPGMRLNVGIYNLTDKKHWFWSDVRNLTASSGIADAFSQPGRHARVSLVTDF